MPKSKRAQVVHLSKVKKKPRTQKDALIDDLRATTDQFANAYVLEVENQRNKELTDVRKHFRPGRIYLGKNKVMAVALGDCPEKECQDNIHKMTPHLQGICALLFTDQAPEEVLKFCKSFQPSVQPRCGTIATETVTLPAGPDTLVKFPFSMEVHLRKLGMPTILKDGKIILLGDYVVCTEGEMLNAQQAQLLKLLQHDMDCFRLKVICRWSKGGDFQEYVDQ
mmetsp:Transcript_31769/g.71239  ORF Transcript_31769/g.71239 Transcript_31769/m.71239 type:complete len:223 (-) Transcript_31769:124-792(-)